MSSKQLFKNCINRKIDKSQFQFTPRHPFDLAIKKVSHFKQLYNICLKECLILQRINTISSLFAFGATDLKFSILFTEDRDKVLGKLKNTFYIPKSLRDENCLNKSSFSFKVTHIFEKRNSEKSYSSLLYISSNKEPMPLESKEKISRALLYLLDK